MKSFIIACVVLGICVGYVVVLQYHVNDTIGKITDEISSFEDHLETNKAPEQLRCLDNAIDIWHGRRWSVCLSLNHREYDDIEEALLALRSAVNSCDGGNYSQSISALREKLDRLRASEKLTVEGVL